MPTAMPNPSHDEQAAASTNLPALIPSATALVRRAQTTLGLLRGVVEESSAEYWYKRGKDASAKQSWEEAESAFKACILRDSNHYRATLQMAYATMQQNKYDTATFLLQKSYYLPYLESSHWGEELSNDEWQLLCDSFEMHKSLTDDKFNVLLALAIIYTSTDYVMARKTLDVTQTLYPSLTEQSATWHILNGLADINDFKKAWISFKRAVDVSQDSAAVYYRIGLAEEEKYDDEGFVSYGYAVPEYKKAAELDENHAQANYKIAKFHYGVRNHSPWNYSLDDALFFYGRTIEIAPDFTNAYLERGDIQPIAADRIRDFSRVIELDQKSVVGYLRRANTYRIANKYDEAIADFNECIKLGYNYISVYIEISSMYIKLGKRGNALSSLNDGINFFIDSGDSAVGDYHIADAYYKRGEIKSILKDYIGAIEDFAKCVEIYPRRSYAYKMIADVKNKINDCAGAAEDKAKI